MEMQIPFHTQCDCVDFSPFRLLSHHFSNPCMATSLYERVISVLQTRF